MPSPPCRPSARRESRSARSAPRAAGPLSGAPLAAVATGLALLAGCGGDSAGSEDRFDADRAFERIESQVAFGQRPAGSPTLRKLGDQLRSELPDGRFEPVAGGLRNVVGSLPGSAPAIVVGAHYDTEAHPPGFVGANDGAAGTAAVVELARLLPQALPDEHREIRFVLFDGEEEPLGCPDAKFAQCGLRGSKAYVAAHPGEIGEMILLDYIASEGARFRREGNSNPDLWAELRGAAERVGEQEAFPDGTQGGGVIDDHIPFVQAGVPAIDLIDFSYPHADTVEDTPDKLSVDSLDAVGETVAELVLSKAGDGG